MRNLDNIVPSAYPESQIRTIGIIVSGGFAASPIPMIGANYGASRKVQYYVIFIFPKINECSSP